MSIAVFDVTYTSAIACSCPHLAATRNFKVFVFGMFLLAEVLQQHSSCPYIYSRQEWLLHGVCDHFWCHVHSLECCTNHSHDRHGSSLESRAQSYTKGGIQTRMQAGIGCHISYYPKACLGERESRSPTRPAEILAPRFCT